MGLALLSGCIGWEKYINTSGDAPQTAKNLSESYCMQDADCSLLDVACCGHHPCKSKSMPLKSVNNANKEKVEQVIKASCPPVCPDYAPPRCFDCLDLEKFEPACVNNECSVKREIDCEAYCKAVAKNASEACPWISNESLITPQNTIFCECPEKQTIAEITCTSTSDCDEKFKFMGTPCETGARLMCVDSRCVCT